jgi:cytochrome bd-type quinol oxidase subunit 2
MRTRLLASISAAIVEVVASSRPRATSWRPKAMKRIINDVGVILILVLVAAIWLIYFASYESQTTVFELWGWAAALFKIVIGLALLIYVRRARNRDQMLIWHLLLTVGGYMLVAWGVLGLLLEFLPVSSLDQWRESP